MAPLQEKTAIASHSVFGIYSRHVDRKGRLAKTHGLSVYLEAHHRIKCFKDSITTTEALTQTGNSGACV